MWLFKCFIEVFNVYYRRGRNPESVDFCIRWHINTEFAASDFCCLQWKTHLVSVQWQMLMLLVFWSYLRNFIKLWLYVKLSCVVTNEIRLTDKLFVCSTLRPQTHMIPINVKGDSIIVDLNSVVEDEFAFSRFLQRGKGNLHILKWTRRKERRGRSERGWSDCASRNWRSLKNAGVKRKVKNLKTLTRNMYFPNLRTSTSAKAFAGVSLKYAFKLMRDLITHLHSAQILSLPLSLHLLSSLIFFWFLLPLSILLHLPLSLTHTFSLPLCCSQSDLLSPLRGTHYLLEAMELLKR